MPYGNPASNSDRGEYTASFDVEADGVNFSTIGFSFKLSTMPITNEGNLDEIFESLITHIADHPLVIGVQANKAWVTTQTVTPVEA